MEKVQPISVYLAGPVDSVPDEDSRGWRERLAKEVPATIMLFSPTHAVLNDNEHNAAAVVKVNYAAIAACDAILVNLTQDVRVFGTIMEINAALRSQTYVSIAGRWVEDHLMAVGLPVFDTVDEAMNDIISKVAEFRKIKPSDFGVMIGFPGRIMEREEEDPDDEPA